MQDRSYPPITLSPRAANFRLSKVREFTVMSVEPSGAGKDETAYAVIKVCRDMLYLVDSGGLAGG